MGKQTGGWHKQQARGQKPLPSAATEARPQTLSTEYILPQQKMSLFAIESWANRGATMTKPCTTGKTVRLRLK
jgi:hypothetical protein